MIFFQKTTAFTHTMYFSGFSKKGFGETGFGKMGMNLMTGVIFRFVNNDTGCKV